MVPTGFSIQIFRGQRNPDGLYMFLGMAVKLGHGVAIKIWDSHHLICCLISISHSDGMGSGRIGGTGDAILECSIEYTLQVGDMQSFVLIISDDEGPFWISPEMKELNHHSRMLPAPPGSHKLQSKTITELKSELNHFVI